MDFVNDKNFDMGTLDEPSDNVIQGFEKFGFVADVVQKTHDEAFLGLSEVDVFLYGSGVVDEFDCVEGDISPGDEVLLEQDAKIICDKIFSLLVVVGLDASHVEPELCEGMELAHGDFRFEEVA